MRWSQGLKKLAMVGKKLSRLKKKRSLRRYHLALRKRAQRCFQQELTKV
jgi:hypothetical protein